MIHKSRGSRGILPWKIFVNMTSRMARMHLALLILRQFDLQLIPQNLIVPLIPISDFSLQVHSTLFQADFDHILTFLLNDAWIVYFFFEKTMKMSISFDKRGKFRVELTGTAKHTFIEKKYSFVFILKILTTAVVKYLKLKCEKIITAQYSIYHCTFSIHHCTNWSSLHLKLTLADAAKFAPCMV